MKLVDRFAFLYKPIRNEADIASILSMLQYVIYTLVIISLIMRLIFGIYEIAEIVITFILAYSLPRRKSRFIAGVLLISSTSTFVASFFTFPLTITPLNWTTIIRDLLYTMIMSLMLIFTWLAFRSLQATFIFHRIKHSRIIWKNVLAIPVILMVGIFFIIVIFAASRLRVILPNYAQYGMLITCVVAYIFNKYNPTIHYTDGDERA